MVDLYGSLGSVYIYLPFLVLFHRTQTATCCPALRSKTVSSSLTFQRSTVEEISTACWTWAPRQWVVCPAVPPWGTSPWWGCWNEWLRLQVCDSDILSLHLWFLVWRFSFPRSEAGGFLMSPPPVWNLKAVSLIPLFYIYMTLGISL